MSGHALGYAYAGSTASIFSQNGTLLITSSDLLWVISDTEALVHVDGGVNYVYRRRSGGVGVSTSAGLFYEVARDTLIPIHPDSYDLIGSGQCGDFYRESQSSGAYVTHRLARADGSVIAEFSDERLEFSGVRGDVCIFFRPGVGVLSSRKGDSWDFLFSPNMPLVKYQRCLGKYLLVFGEDNRGQAVCEVYDLEAHASTGVFVFDQYSGAVSEINECDQGWYFLWGDGLFRFNGLIVESLLPGHIVSGYYLAHDGVCVLFSDEGLMRFYDLDLRAIRDEQFILSGYVFGYFSSDGDRLVGSLHPSGRVSGLNYAVTLSKLASGCPSFVLEQQSYRVEKRNREQVFDVVVHFSRTDQFSSLLRQALAILDETFCQYADVLNNPEAACFSGLVELSFDTLLTSEQRGVLQDNCRDISAIISREAPATGDPFHFRLVFLN